MRRRREYEAFFLVGRPLDPRPLPERARREFLSFLDAR